MLKRIYVSIALLGSIFILGAKPVILQYKPELGRKLRYKMTITTNTTAEMDAQTQTTKTQMTIKFTREVKSIEADTVIFNVTIESIEGSMKMNGMEMPIQGLDNLKGKVFTIKTVGDKIVEKTTPDELEKINFTGNIETEFKFFSEDKSHKPGSEWKLVFEDELNKSVTYCKFEKIEERNGYKCAKIVFNTEYSISSGKNAQNMEEVKVEGKGTSQGEIYFAFEEGFTVYEKTKSSLEGKSTIPQMGQTINSYTDIISEIELLK